MHKSFEPLPNTFPVPLHEMTGCKWPVGEHPVLFCNEATGNAVLQVYCEAHQKMGTTPRITKGKGKRGSAWDTPATRR